MSYLTDKYYLRLQALMDYRDGSVYERITNINPSASGIKMIPGQGLFSPTPGTNVLNYGNVFNISDSTQPFTQIVMVDLLKCNYSSNISFIVNKAGGGATLPGWCLYVSGGQFIFIGGPDNTHNIAHKVGMASSLISQAGGKFILITSYDGTWSTTAFTSFLNGYFTTTSTVTGAFSSSNWSNAVNLTIGNIASYIASQYTVKLFAKMSGTITPAEMADIYDHLSSEVSATSKAYSIPAKYPYLTQADYSSNLFVYDFPMSLSNGKITDLVKGYTITNKKKDISSNASFNSIFRNSTTNPSNSLANLGLISDSVISYGSGTNFTVSAWIKTPDTTTASVVLESGLDTNSQNGGYAFYVNDSVPNSVSFAVNGGGSWAKRTLTGKLQVNKWTHVVGTFDSTTPSIKIYIDGIEQTDASTIGNQQSVTLANYSLNLFARNGTTAPFKGTIGAINFRKKTLSASEVRSEYLKGAQTIIFDGRLQNDGSCPVMIRPALKIGNTPWYYKSGVIYLLEDAPSNGILGRRFINPWGSAPRIDLKVPNAYGSWYMRFKWNVGSGIRFLNIVKNSDVAAQNTAGINCYALYFRSSGALSFYRFSGTSYSPIYDTGITNLCNEGTEYEMWLSRRYDGLWTLYFKGGQYTTWTSIFSGTENTHTSGNYMEYKNDNNTIGTGERIYDFKYFMGTMTPDEATSLGII